MKSTCVGRGEIAHLISQFQTSSTAVERIVRANKLNDSEKTEAALELAIDLIQLVTNAALLTAGFHTHHRQWRPRCAGVSCRAKPATRQAVTRLTRPKGETHEIDLYTKAVLIVIAACLVWICLRDVTLVRPAQATSPQGAIVKITAIDDGVILPVSIDAVRVNKGLVPVQQK